MEPNCVYCTLPPIETIEIKQIASNPPHFSHKILIFISSELGFKIQSTKMLL